MSQQSPNAPTTANRAQRNSIGRHCSGDDMPHWECRPSRTASGEHVDRGRCRAGRRVRNIHDDARRRGGLVELALSPSSPPIEILRQGRKDMSDKLHEGQDVSWRWGGGNASGKVAEIVEEGKAEVTSNKGNTVTRNAREGDPAVKIARSGNDVVKLAHELNEVKEAE